MRQHISHTAHRPTWLCRNDGQPWPCETARTELLAEHRDWPTVLRTYLFGMRETAMHELPDLAGGELDARFLNWAWEPARR